MTAVLGSGLAGMARRVRGGPSQGETKYREPPRTDVDNTAALTPCVCLVPRQVYDLTRFRICERLGIDACGGCV